MENSMQVIERSEYGYCLVGENWSAMQIVTYDAHALYSTWCSCDDAKAGKDCDHRFYVDRFFDARRDAQTRALRPVLLSPVIAPVAQVSSKTNQPGEQFSGCTPCSMPAYRSETRKNADVSSLNVTTLARGQKSVSERMMNAQLNYSNCGFSLFR